MALELTEQQLKDLGFNVEDMKKDSERYIKIYAQKKIKHSEAFFYYFYSFDTKSNEVKHHRFDLLCGDVSIVISNIETLERFHELERVLNKE